MKSDASTQTCSYTESHSYEATQSSQVISHTHTQGNTDEKKVSSLNNAHQVDLEDVIFEPTMRSRREPSGFSKKSKTSLSARDQLKKARRAMHITFRRTPWYIVVYLIGMPIYLCLGGLLFKFIEGEEYRRIEQIWKERCRVLIHQSSDQLISACNESLQSNHHYRSAVDEKLFDIRDCFEKAEIDIGSPPSHPLYNYGHAIMYAYSIVSTVGWGSAVPKTAAGRFVTVVYALFGCPYFMAILSDFSTWTAKALRKVIAFLACTGKNRPLTESCEYEKISAATIGGTDLNRPQGIAKAVKSNDETDNMNQWRDRFNNFWTKAKMRWHVDPTSNRPTVREPKLNVKVNPDSGDITIDPISSHNLHHAFVRWVATLLTLATITCAYSGIDIIYEFNNWSYTDAMYAYFQSITAIGFGDYTPKVPETEWIMILCITYTIFGTFVGQIFWSMYCYYLQQQIQGLGASIRRRFFLWRSKRHKNRIYVEKFVKQPKAHYVELSVEDSLRKQENVPGYQKSNEHQKSTIAPINKTDASSTK